MLLITHIFIALLGLVSAGFSFIKPSAKHIHTSYALIGLTVVTGTILTIQTPAHLMQSCVVGLVYLSATFMAIIAARLKLAQQ